MRAPSWAGRAWSRVPSAARSWLSTYAGPVLGVLVVTGLLVNLVLQPRDEEAGTTDLDSQQTGQTGQTAALPQLVTVQPDYDAKPTGGQAERAVSGRAARPTGLRLSNGVVVPVKAVGTTADGELDVPDDIRTAGWWRGGSRLGDPFGSMLIAAHVDSRTQGLGPYSALLSVQPGARFVVSARQGQSAQTFAVSERRIVARDRLGTVKDIFSPSGSPRLTMVTCAGPYVKDDGGYQNLAVVTAEPVGPVEDLAG